MSAPLLVEYYERLPPLRPDDDEELWAAGAQAAVRKFRDRVRKRYAEGTLQRLLAHDDVRARRAAAFALGLLGTMQSNPGVAAALKDDDPLVRRFASDGLWEIWGRAGTPEQNLKLEQAGRLTDPDAERAALDELIKAAPDFAEAHNKRAIARFRRGDYARSVEDCETVLRLNPFHFGAAAGMGQCFLKLKKPRSALRAFEHALEINPTLDHLRETIAALQEALGNSRDGE